MSQAPHIDGVLIHTSGNYKLAPRKAGDIVSAL